MNYFQMLINPLKDRTNQVVVPKQPTKKQENRQPLDPQSVIPYQQSLLYPLQQQQNFNMSYLNPRYMDDQPDLNAEIRSSMVEELHRMCRQYQVQRATFHISVYFMDAYLSKKKFIAAQINVLLKTCFFMASKYEEIHPTPVWYYANDKFEKDAIIQCEHEILLLLDFRLIVVSSHVWLNYYWSILKVQQKNPDWLNYSNLLIDVAAYFNFSCEPSKIACAALYSSNQNIQTDWNSLAQQYRLHFTHEINEATNLIQISLKNCVARKYEVVKHISVI